MLFIVTGLTVESNQYIHTSMDVGCCCAYMYVQHTNFEGGEDSHEEGEDSPPWPYVEKTLLASITAGCTRETFTFPLICTVIQYCCVHFTYRSEIYCDSRQQTAEGGGTAEKDL